MKGGRHDSVRGRVGDCRWSCSLLGGSSAEPVRVSSANPHYFAWNGRPVVLVTSDHHYGAVIDRDFDYVRYLDAMAAAGMNLTRIYPGAMFEAADKYVAGNPLGPRPGRHILPLGTVDGARRPSRTRRAGRPVVQVRPRSLEPEYFARLRAFVAAAAARRHRRRGRVLQRDVADSWPLMPFLPQQRAGRRAYEVDGVRPLHDTPIRATTTCSATRRPTFASSRSSSTGSTT